MKEEQLDDIDRRILRALSRDARISNQKLAESVSLSPTPCWNRVRALENSGVIAEYVTILDQTSLGFPDTVIIEVTLDRQGRATVFGKFEQGSSIPLRHAGNESCVVSHLIRAL